MVPYLMVQHEYRLVLENKEEASSCLGNTGRTFVTGGGAPL